MRSFSKALFFTFLLASQLVHAQQQGWWTWIKGTATSPVTSGAAVFGTQGVPAAGNTPESMYQSAACWTDSQGNLWQYGGGNVNYSSALFKYNPGTNMWTWVQGPNTLGNAPVWGTKGVAAPANTPGQRGMGVATWVDAQDNLWLFGGNSIGSGGGTIKGWMADLWKYDPVTNMWTWMSGPSQMNQAGVYGTQGVTSPANFPTGRYECNATWVDAAGNFWLFGGGSQMGTMNDLWKYNPTTNQWTWMKGSQAAGNAGTYGTKGVAAAANNPPARWAYCRWKDNNGNFWLFGGTHSSNTQSMNDLWKFDPTTNNWTWMSGSNLKDQLPALPAKCIPSTTAYPQARYENPIAWKDICGNLWMFGGHWAPGLSAPDINDIWCYKVATNEWVLVGGNISANNGVPGTQGVPAATNIPPSQYGAAAWSYNNVFWLFGGRAGNSGTDVNSLWRYYPDTTCAQSTCTVANPNAGFNSTTLSGCEDLTVTFNNTSTNSTSWNWNFGDGSNSTTQNPTHTYTAAGTYTVTQIAYNGGNSDTLVQPNYITVFPSAVAAFTASTNTVCIGQTATFTNGSSNASSYTWNFGDGGTSTATDPTHSYTSTGTYTVTLIAVSANGCNDTLTQPMSVLSSSVTASYTQSANGCAPLTVTFNNTSVGATTYTWTLGNGQTAITTSATATYTAAGTYSVSLISSTNSICGVASDTAYSTVIIGQSPSLTMSALTNVSCFGGSNGTGTVSATGGSTPYTYLWNPTSVASATATGLSAGIYTVTVTDATGCSSTQSITITQPAALTASITTTQATCNSSDGTATANAASGTVPYTYLWNNGQSSQTATGLAAGNYSCTVTDANGCSQIFSSSVSSTSGPTASVSANVNIQQGSSTTLSASGGISFAWSPASSLNDSTLSNPVATPSSTTTYCVFVYDANGCYDSACVIVTVEVPCGVFYLPNAFSPNEDGENEVFKAYVNPLCVTEFKLIIYNRWGEKIFETNDVTNGWDGKVRDVISNSAVYAYYCKVKLTDGKEIFKEGNVSLVR